MKLATFNTGTGDHVGIVNGDEVVDLTAADPSLATMIDLLDRDPREAASAGSAPRLALSGVRLRPPVPRPPKFLAIGYDYAALAGRLAPAVAAWLHVSPDEVRVSLAGARVGSFGTETGGGHQVGRRRMGSWPGYDRRSPSRRRDPRRVSEC